jgi:hypothetical protein
MVAAQVFAAEGDVRPEVVAEAAERAVVAFACLPLTLSPRFPLAFTFLLFVVYNLFHAFLDLKPQARAGRSEKYWADLIAAEFVVTFHRPPKRT